MYQGNGASAQVHQEAPKRRTAAEAKTMETGKKTNNRESECVSDNDKRQKDKERQRKC